MENGHGHNSSEKGMRENKEDKEKDLLSLLKSWDVENYLEEQNDDKICKYFKSTGVCPYQEVGCMFEHQDKQNELEKDDSNDEEQEEEENKPTTLRTRERLSARSRNRKVNEERFRRLRDLSISCS